MSRIFGHLLLILLGMGLMALVGHVIDLRWTASGWGAWIGAALGVSWVVVRDGLQGRRLMEWLRRGEAAAAPRSRRFWGEMAYRVERSLLLRERERDAERRRLAEFLSAIEASPNGVMLLDAHEQITWCNSVAADHFGLDPQRDRGQRVTNLVRTPAFVSLLQAPPQEEAVSVLNHHTGTTLSVLLREYADGHRIVLTQDVTERLQAEAMRRDFVANVSHEIRTPLTVLAGFVETMQSLPLTEVERTRVLGLMNQQTRRMQTLVADLLTLAQLEGSPRPAADHWVAVADLFQQAESEARGLSRGRHTVILPAPEVLSGWQVAGNQSELQSALTNLTSNAVRYTPDGGAITLDWYRRDSGESVFEVRDTGIGIEREHLPRLTERFYRVDGSRSRETGGTGLGLSIVKHVVQRHGALLEVDSTPGSGSRFRVIFPAVRLRERRVAAVGG